MDYLPMDAAVFFCESGRVDERAKAAWEQLRQDMEPLLEAGLMTGEYANLSLSVEELYAALEAFPVIMMGSLPTSRYPMKPKGLLTINARQLSSYGGSLETAVTDLAHSITELCVSLHLSCGTANCTI
jgi:transcription-repair coupling factor (superfamily II helicase)